MAGAALVVAARGRAQSLSTALWTLWAGVAGGALATAGLSTESIADGTGGLALAGLGGVAGAALLSAALAVRLPARLRRRGEADQGVGQRPRRVAPEAEPPAVPSSRDRGSWPAWLVPVAGGLVAVGLGWAGLGWVGVLALLLLAAPALTPYRLSFAGAFFAAASLVSAAEVVAGRLLLSPLGWVGEEVPTALVAVLTLLPLLVRTAATWRVAARGLGLVDLAVLAVAGVAGVTWWSLFRGLGSDDSVSQLLRLGEDHLSHLLMLEATSTSGTSLGASAASTEVTTLFAGYLPGASIWQAAVGGLTSGLTTTQVYVLSTAVLLSLLAGSATAAVGRVAGRLDAVAVLGVLALGVVGTRATLAMYELGFPGQLLTACWFVTAFTLVVAVPSTFREGLPVAGAVTLLALATWWTWNLAAPVLALPVVVLVGMALRRRGWLPGRLLAAVLGGAVVLGGLAALVLRDHVVAQLNLLTIEGGVFRSIPLWFPYLLVLGLPLALRAMRREVPPPATALVLGMAAATLALTCWQLLKVGAPTYYSYKLEYLMLALCWAIGGVCVAASTRRRPALPSRRGQLAAAAVAVVLAVPLLLWPADNYRGWLTARKVLGVDAAISCAVEAAAGAPDGDIALAVGFGDPLGDYLTIRAMDVGVGNNLSSPFWYSVRTTPDPATWPWAAAAGPVVVVRGPAATPAQTAALVDAARAAGKQARVVASCPR